MHVLLSDGKNELRLTPVRRRPEGWALIELKVKMDRGSWEALDECLERREVRWLVRWLRKIARGQTPKELGFTEPNLRFECLRNPQPAVVRVWFEGEVRPSWAPYEHWSMEDLWLDLEVPREQVRQAAEALAHELEAVEAG